MGISVFLKRALVLVAFGLMAMSAVQKSEAGAITIAPGAAPSSYLPLSLFGVAPYGGVTSNGFQSINTFSFTFAGVQYSQLQMGEDGLLALGASAPANSANNRSLPDAGFAGVILAPFWTDLDITLGGAMRAVTLTDGVTSWNVFEWENMRLANSLETASFQVWIETGLNEGVHFVYGNVSGSGPLTVGAQNQSGTAGVDYYYDGTGTRPVNGMQLRVASVVPEPAGLGLMVLGLFAVAGFGRRHLGGN